MTYLILHPDLFSESNSDSSINLFFYLKTLDTSLEKAFNACKPSSLVKNQIKRTNDTLFIKEHKILLEHKNVFICGAGKATHDIVKTLIPILGSNYKKGIINIPKGTNNLKENLPHTEIIQAGHPIPDTDTFEGTRKQIRLLNSLSKDDIVFVVISGGASALLELPDLSITQDDLTKTYKQLLVSGLPINKINTLRKYLSLVKGGKLLEQTRAQVYGLLLSDVPGDDLSAIGSGPTISEQDLEKKCQKILKNNPLQSSLPIAVKEFIFSPTKNPQSSLQIDTSSLQNAVNILLGSNWNFIETLVQHLSDNKIDTTACSRIFSGEAQQIGSFLHQYSLFPYTAIPKCLVFGGESVVTIINQEQVTNSRGGRNQELVLSFIINFIQKKSLMDVVVLSIGTDGIDGLSDNAGAIFCSELVKNKELALPNLTKKLSNHDSAQSLPLEYYIKIGQTGTNVGDILVFLTY